MPRNIAGDSNTVTVTFNQTASYPDVRVLEYSGADPTGPLDVTTAAAGTGPTATSGSAVTNSLSELVFGAGMTFTFFTTAGSGFTNRVITNFGDIAEDATVLSTGSYSATAPLTSSSSPWLMQMATFRATGLGSSNPAPTLSSIAPSSGPASGGAAVTITGTGFQSGAMVSLGGTAATGVTVASSTKITATTAAHPAGAVNVVVTNLDNQSGTLSNGYSYNAATGGTIAYVQGKSATQTSSASVEVTYPAAQTAGNLNVVAVMWGETTSAVSSVTDSKGNTYMLAVGPTKTTGLTSAIYYANNIAGGSNMVTVQFNRTAGYPNVNVLEYAGLDTANPLDVSVGGSGSGTAANSGTATTTSASELIVGLGNPSTVFTGPGAGFTNRMINAFGGISEDRIVSSTGSYNATATLTSGAWEGDADGCIPRRWASSISTSTCFPALCFPSLGRPPGDNRRILQGLPGDCSRRTVQPTQHQRYLDYLRRFNGSVERRLLLCGDHGRCGRVGEYLLERVQICDPYSVTP